MKKIKKIGLLLLVLMMSVSVLAGCGSDGNVSDDASTGGEAVDNTDKPKVTIGYVNWADDVAMTELAKVVLEDKMGYDVEINMAEAGVIFTSLADGSTDFFLDLWLPVTHEDYFNKYEEDLVKLGKSYDTAKIGLAVPAHVEIDSIEELKDSKDKFEGKIIGIDSGAGVMKATEEVIEAYGLEMDLLTGSEPVMTASLADSIDSGDWVAVTAWDPHWKFAKWDLKFLEDPKNVYGDGEVAYTVARKGTKEDMPEVHEFMENFHLEIGEISDLMNVIEEGRDIEADVRGWVADNEDVVNAWIPTK